MSEAVCLKDIEEAAHKILPKKALDYYKSGAEQQSTLRDNCRAFQRCRESKIAYFVGILFGSYIRDPTASEQLQMRSYNPSRPRRYRLLPRVLNDVSYRDLRTTVLGGRHSVSMPIGISPTAMQATARELAEPFFLSLS